MTGGIPRRRFLASLLCAPALAAQDDVTFSTDVKVVNVMATVRTKKGEIVRDLSKDDFTIAENGRPQAIRYFARESGLPLTLGLMVDTSMSQRRVIDAERGASLRFFDQVLRPAKDQAFVMQFDMTVQLRQNLTQSIRDLEESLAYVDTPSRQELELQTSGGTLLYDAVVKASNEIMAKLTGRKALIVLSDGVDFGSEQPISAAVDAAERADTLIYAILFSDATFYGGGLFSPDGRGALARMSRETGGSLSEVSKKRSLEQIFGEVENELRSQYSLGYVSDEPVRISEFRKIQLTTKEKGLVVQSRDRYWARR